MSSSLGNVIVGHLETLLSKRGAEPPDDVLGFFGGASRGTQEDETQQWWGAREQEGLAREMLGQESRRAAAQEERTISTEL